MIYVWTVSDEYPEKLIGEYDRELSPDRFMFKQSEEQILNKEPVVRFSATTEELCGYDELANDALIPLVSEKVLAVLNKWTSDIQFIKTRVVTSNGELSGYYIVNALRSVDVLNREESQFQLVPGTEQIMSYQKLVYQDDNVSIARDSNFMSHLLIGEEIACSLKESCKEVGVFRPDELNL